MCMTQGFPRVRSEKAVYHTHNCGVEPAVHWLMEHSEDTDLDTPLNLAVRYMRLAVWRLLKKQSSFAYYTTANLHLHAEHFWATRL